MALRRNGEAQPIGQVLIYPVLTTRTDLPSMVEHDEAPMMTVAGLQNSLAGFVPDAVSRLDECAMPLEAKSHHRLAPAFIGVAEIDPLRDHGVEYASALGACGVSAELVVGQGMIHSSLRAFGVEEVETLYDRMVKWMSDRFVAHGLGK
jgi:acetyl esterase